MESSATPREPKSWFYAYKGEQRGSISEPEMEKLLKEKQLSKDSLVWREGFSDWLKLENTELEQYLDKTTPPPLTGDATDNKVVWILAFAPIIGFFLEFVVAYMYFANEYRAEEAVYNGNLFFITVVLNVALGYWDESRLRKGGFDTGSFKSIVWLVPVYLFKRTQALGHKKHYFITWLVCFGLIIIDTATSTY